VDLERSSAPVTIDGHTLFRVRGVSAYPAEQRARVIADRIEALAADETVSLESLRVVETEGRSVISAADQPVMNVFDADGAFENIARQPLALLYRARIAEAITAYRQDRSPRALLIGAGHAAAATVLAALLVWGIRRTFQRLRELTERRFKARIQGLQFQSFQIVQAERLWAGIQTAQRTVYVLLMVAVAFVYLEYVLALFPWTKPLSLKLFAILLNPIRQMAVAVLAAVPNLVFLAVLILVVRYGLQMLRLFFSGIARGTLTLTGFDREWAMPTFRLLRLGVVAFTAVIAYPYVPGSQSEAFKGVSIFLGVILSLGSSSAISNVIAGYTMIYRRAFKVGDRVKIDDLIGDVTEMRLLVTHLRSPKNEEIVVPNSMILNTHVINYSSLAEKDGLILHTTVGIGYETPWRQVEAMLLQAAERTPGLIKNPPPFVLQKELGDFAVTYELNVYTDKPQESLQIYTELHRNILDLFNEYGVQIMTPAYEGDPSELKVVPKDKWFAPPALSSPLADNTKDALRSSRAPDKDHVAR
jgi:small-conductance mechanosensitive channel